MNKFGTAVLRQDAVSAADTQLATHRLYKYYTAFQ